MSRKNILAPTVVESSHSLSASFNSTPTVINWMDNCAYQINVTTSDSVGAFTVQGSLDYVPATSNTNLVAGNWATLSLGGDSLSVSSADDTMLINLNQLPFNAIRVHYQSSVAGTGHAQIIVMLKQVGG